MTNVPSSTAALPAGPRFSKTGALAYLGMLAVGVALFLAIRAWGETLEAPVVEEVREAASVEETAEVDVVFYVLTTLSSIIALGYVLGRVLRWFGQPPVIGEVMAGLILGPSVLGALSPDLAHLIVPSPATDPNGIVMSALKAISRLGIVIYMFLVGLELNVPQLRKRAHAAVAISHSSILVPFILGAVLALWLYPLLSSQDVSFTSFAMFMGVAMAITAFPVLARILTDQGLEKTELGVVALSCAAADDVSAWCLLALVIGMAHTTLGEAASVFVGAFVYLSVMVFLVRPVALRVWRRVEYGDMPSWTIPLVLVAVMISGLTTKLIGIHTLFGGFVMGVIMPHDGRLTEELKNKLRDISMILLLPAFFAITGLRTEISLLDNAGDWLIAAVIILVATVGKFGGTVVAARFTGMDWRQSAALGALMNTRGLMELIVLNIGLEIGVISPTLFAMMVLMALATTLMTAPVLRWILPETS